MESIINEIMFVNEQIENKNYIILPDNIAIGNVYKIHASGDLKQDGYEVGYLYLPAGSGIKNHTHITDVERYKLLVGNLSINNSNMSLNICEINDSHSIDVVNEPTIIQTCKISILNLDRNCSLSSATFDEIIYKENKQK